MKQINYYKDSITRSSWMWRYAMMLVGAFFITTQAFSQVAPVNPPLGGFAIDGNLRAGIPTTPAPFAPNQGDWVAGTGTGG